MVNVDGVRYLNSTSAVDRLEQRFKAIRGSKNQYEVWRDMIWLFATTLCNTIRHPWREQRETVYMQTVQRYTQEEQRAFADLLGEITVDMERMQRGGRFADLLGDLFMRLGLGNAHGGQFFTPYHICEMTAAAAWDDAVITEIEQQGYITACDPACGAGALLIAFAQTLAEHGIDYQRHCLFVAGDIDYTTALMCYIQLSILGCAGYVHIGNSLTDRMNGDALFGDGGENTWYTPMYYTLDWSVRRTAACIRGRERAGKWLITKQI